MAIYKTPDGTLYNTAILEQSYEEEFDAKNVKRENKVNFFFCKFSSLPEHF